MWEQGLTADLAAAGVEYIILDDSHFKSAGLDGDDLWGYYLTEDNGRLLRVFPGSERLRYTIPFAAQHESVDYLRGIAERLPNAVAVFADDGEKFGSWPETKKPVYEDGWLRQFFDLMRANGDWIHWTTPSETIDQVAPLGKIYIPEGSYREMNEWVLQPDQLQTYEASRAELKKQPQWAGISRFVHGGVWRNFLVKYPEINEMYSRMTMVSQRLHQLTVGGVSSVPPPHMIAERPASDFARRFAAAGQHRAVSGPVQLQLLARGVWRRIFAAFAQCGLPTFDCGRQFARSGRGPARFVGRSAFRRFEFGRPAGSACWPAIAAWPCFPPAAAASFMNWMSAKSATIYWPR